MSNPLNSINDDILGGIDDDLRAEFRAFTGNDLTRGGLSQSNFEDVNDAAEALVKSRISNAITTFTQANGTAPSRSEVNTLRDQLAPQYQQRLTRFQAESARRRRAQGEAARATEVGVTGLAGAAVGQAATGLVTGIGRLGTLSMRAGAAARRGLGLGTEEENRAQQDRLDNYDQVITDFREGVQQEIALPGAKALQQELAQQAADDPDAGFGTSAARSLTTILGSPNRTQYLTEMLAYGIGASFSGGVATGALRGAAALGATRIGTNVAVGAAARLNGTTSIAAGQALVGAGEVGEDVRQQYLELDRQGLLANSPDFQQFYDTIDSASETGVPYDEARDRYIRNRAATGRFFGGALTGVTTFLAPATEAAMFGFGKGLASRSVSAGRDVLPTAPGNVLSRVAGGAARESVFEGIEEVGQQAIPNFVGGLEQDGAALGQAAAAGFLLGGASGGAVGALQRNPTTPDDPLGLPAPEPDAPVVSPPADPDLLLGLGRGQANVTGDAPTAEQQAAGLNLREQELVTRFAAAPAAGFVPSAQLAADLTAPDGDRELLAERASEEGATRRRPAAGTFSVTDAAGASGLDPQDAQRLRSLIETGDGAAYLEGSEGADRSRLVNNALRYANSTPGDGDPITNIDLAVRAANDPAVIGPVNDPEVTRSDAMFGARVAQVLKRRNVSDAGFESGPKSVFGRAGRTGAVAEADIHKGAYSPNNAFETYYSDPDGRDFAIALDQGQIVYRDEGQETWQEIEEGDSTLRREALTKGYAAAAGDPTLGTQDTDLITVLDDVSERTALAAAARVETVGENEFTAASEAFVTAAAQAAPTLREQARVAQEAAVQYLRSPQAVEAWQQSTEGATKSIVLPPANTPGEALAGDYIGTVIASASAELGRLQSPFDEPNPASRLTKVRNSLNRSEDLRATEGDGDVVASGSAQMNAFIRELAGTDSPTQRAALADRVSQALADGDAEATIGDLSLAQTPDGFFVQAGPAGSLRSATPTADLLAVAHATLRRAIREERLERILDRDLAIRDGDVYSTQPIDQDAIGVAFRQTDDPLLSIEAQPRATPVEAVRGAQAIVSALQSTPGVDPLSSLSAPSDPALAQAQDAAALADEIAGAAPETLLDIVERVRSVPDSHLNSGTLHGLKEAANRLQRAHQFAKSAPATARQRFTNTMSRLRHAATSLEAQTGQRVTMREPTPEQIARIEGPAVLKARHDAFMSAQATRSEVVEERIAAAKLARPGVPDSEVAIALEAPPTAQEIEAVAAQEQAARAVENDVLGPVVEGEQGTRFKYGDAVPNPIDDATFQARVQQSRDALRGQRINLKTYDTFDQYLSDLATTFAGANTEEAVRKYIASVPRFAGQFTQKSNGAEVVLIREAIGSEAALERVLSHEITGHYRLADIVGPAEYSRIRRTIQAATPKINGELYAMRKQVEKELRASMKRDPRYDEKEATRLMKTSSFAEQIADEVLGTLAERLVAEEKITKETGVFVGRMQEAFDAAGLPTRSAGTRWVGRMLQLSQDTSFSGGKPRMMADAAIARAGNGFQRLKDKREFTVLDESWAQRIYRRGLNSVAYLKRLENATRSLLPEVSRSWREVWLAEDRANRVAKAEEDRILPHVQRVTDVAQQIFDDSGMGRAEFDDVFMGWMNARDYIDRVPNLVLSQMVSENAAFNEGRTALKERIIEEGEQSSGVATYIADLRRLVEDTDARDVREALDSGSAAWLNLTGYTNREIREMLDGPEGQRMAQLAAKTRVGGQTLDEALTGLREAYHDAERKSGTRGDRGVALSRALGLTHYMPQEVRSRDTGVTEQLAATFRAANPELAREGDSDLAVYDMLKSRSPLGFEHDIDPFATRPRNDFLSPLRGSPDKPVTPPLVLLATKAHSVAGAVATQDLHRAVRDAALETREAEDNGDGTTQFSRAVEILEDFDLTTDEGRADFRKLIASGDVVLAMAENGDATAMRVNDKQLLKALSDRHITQSRIEQNAARRTIGQATRFQGRIHTSLDPTFVVFRQAVRDLPEAMLTAGGGEQSFSVAAATNVGAEALGNIRRISGYIFGDPAKKQELLGKWRSAKAGTWEKNFAEFVDQGGQQAFSQGIDDVVSGLAGAGVQRQQFDGVRTPFEFIGDAVQGTTDRVLPERVTGRDGRVRSLVRRIEDFSNLFDNATRFALFNEVRRQRTNRGDPRGEATRDAIEVSNSLLPFNRRSELARGGSSFYAFFNVAVASTDVAFTRRIWKGGEAPTETFQADAGRVGTRLAENWKEQLNWPLATFLVAKGFLATAIALQTVGSDEEDGPEEGRDKFRPGRYMDSTALFGAFVPDQLGVPGAFNGVGAGMALAMFSDYGWDEIVAAQGVNLTKNLTPLNYDSGPETNNALADISRAVLPSFLNIMLEATFDVNRFNAPISRLRNSEQSSNATPQSTAFSPGILAMTREMEDGMEAVFGEGARVDPGSVKWMMDQIGALGGATQSMADQWVRYSTGEPTEVVEGLQRMTRMFPRSPEFASRTGFYRYAREIEYHRNQFKEAAKDDVEAGEAGTESVPAFSPRSKTMGPRARAYLDALPEGFWPAKKAYDGRSSKIGAIKQEVDNIRRSPNPDAERIGELLEEEALLYREALDLMRDAFDDGYDAQFVF